MRLKNKPLLISKEYSTGKETIDICKKEEDHSKEENSIIEEEENYSFNE